MTDASTPAGIPAVKTLPGWESAIFHVLGSLLNSSAIDPQTKGNLNGVLGSVIETADDAPEEAGSAAAAAVGLGATALETRAPTLAPAVETVAPLGEAAVADIVQGVVAGFEKTFASHNAALISAIQGLKSPSI